MSLETESMRNLHNPRLKKMTNCIQLISKARFNIISKLPKSFDGNNGTQAS